MMRCAKTKGNMTQFVELWNDRDAGHRMDFVPLTMKRILYVPSNYTDVRTYRRQ
jgi:hypothetical protein